MAAAGIAFCYGATAQAQTLISLVTTPSIRLTVENPQQLEPVTYSLQINEDGSGVYHALVSSDGGPGEDVQVPVHIGKPLLSQLFDTVRSHKFFAECSPAGGRVAFTGTKTLAYTGPEGAGSCTFNYAREKEMNEVASELIAVAYTLQEGLRLSRDHRYEPLGLDEELTTLQNSAQDHRALELENIAPELQSIAQDGAVMNIARRRAQALLAASTPSR